jgi:hypothetical protein
MSLYPTTLKETLLDVKAQIDSNTKIVGDFSTPLSQIDWGYKQNINKEISELIDMTDQMTRYLQSNLATTQYMLLSSPWNFLQNRSYFRTQNKS